MGRSMMAVLKGDPLELGRWSGGIPRSGGKVAVVSGRCAHSALLNALMPGRLGQLLRLGLQQLVEVSSLRFRLPKGSGGLPLDNFFVLARDLFGLVCCLLSNGELSQLHFY